MNRYSKFAAIVAMIAFLPFSALGEQSVAIPEVRRQPPPPESPLHTQHDVVIGILKNIEENEGRVVITHQSFESLGDPQTTTLFRVNSRAMFKGLRVGQKVKFVAERIDGIATVTWMAPTK